MYRSLLIASSLACVVGAQAADTVDIHARLSVGIAKGFGVTGKEFDTSLSNMTELYDVAVGRYEVSPALNVEVPVLFEWRTSGRLSWMVGPAPLYARNKTDSYIHGFNLLDDESLEISSSETLTTLGAKIYAGGRFRYSDDLSFELLPSVGYASISSKSTGTAKGVLAGDAFSDPISQSQRGHALLYGLTVGTYYTARSGFELGLRIGYTGARGAIKDDGDTIDIEQSGGVFAAETGWKF